MRGFNFLKGHWEAVECVQRLKNDRVSVSRDIEKPSLIAFRCAVMREVAASRATVLIS